MFFGFNFQTIYIFLIILAGEPATNVLAGTFLVTTEAAPTTEFCPIVTPPKITEPIPTQTPLSSFIGFDVCL
jgi:hypothetical protein